VSRGIFAVHAGARSGANLHRRLDRNTLLADGVRNMSSKSLPESILNLEGIPMQLIVFIQPFAHQPENCSGLIAKGPVSNILPVHEADHIFVDDNIGRTNIVIADSDGQVIQSATAYNVQKPAVVRTWTTTSGSSLSTAARRCSGYLQTTSGRPRHGRLG
jgi:hypothetical protein